MAALRAVLDRADAGRPGLAMLVGEAGVGKTRLLGEFAATARAGGARVLLGGCVPLSEQHLPYAPVVEALRELGRSGQRELLDSPELERLLPGAQVPRQGAGPAEALPGESVRSRLFELFLGLLSRLGDGGPVVFAVEDLHWADPATVDLLGFLHRNLSRERVMLVVTYRDEDLAVDHPLRGWLAETARLEDVTGVELPPFTRHETAQQLAGMLGRPVEPGLLDRVFSRSAGNALFTEILLAQPDEPDGPLPATVTDLVLRHARRLSGDARRMLRAAAVVGQRVGHDLLAELTGTPGESLAELVREAIEHRVLLADPVREVYEFRHSLIRQAAYADLLPVERRRLHAATAQALTDHPQWSSGGPATATAELAYHWHAGGDQPRALAASVRAGAAAAEVGAFTVAYEQFERASALWDAVPDPQAVAGVDLVDLYRRTAHLAHLLGLDERAIGLLESALVVPQAAADPTRLALLYERLGWYHLVNLREQDALAAYDRALQLLPPDRPTPERAVVVAGRARLAMVSSRYADCLRYASEAITLGRVTGARREEARGRLALGVAHVRHGACAEGLAELYAARDIFAGLNDPDYLLRAYISLGYALEVAGRLADSAAASAEGYALARRVGLARQLGGFLLCNAADVEFLRGRWDEAARLRTEAELGGMRGGRAVHLYRLSARLATARGDRAAAHGWLVKARELVDPVTAPTAWITGLNLAIGELALAEGRFGDARRAVAQALDGLGGSAEADLAGALLAMGLRIEADAAAAAPARVPDGTAGRVEALSARVTALAAVPEQAAHAAVCAAEAARALRQPSVALWERALARWEALGQPYPAAYAGWRLAEAQLSEAGDVKAAAWTLRSAAGRAADLGAAPLLADVAAVARVHRIRLREPAVVAAPEQAPDPFRLTRREREVLAHLDAGRSNGEIARALFISVKTASVHVTNILRKLDVGRRGEAASMARRLGLLSDGPTALDPTALDPTALDPTALDPTALDPATAGIR
jgi:DNA-binding CsgD family transcriptional regulator/tetratricopeptide (TPR) repeat protein